MNYIRMWIRFNKNYKLIKDNDPRIAKVNLLGRGKFRVIGICCGVDVFILLIH
jgi:hypothetical protein